MNTILDTYDQMPFHTDLALVFRALGGRQKEFDWLITDWECNHYPSALQNDPQGSPCWLSGTQLTEIVEAEQIQFIWAVLSGFPLGAAAIDFDNLETVPFADGNPSFWESEVSLQHSKSLVEIVCWDSTYTMLLSKDVNLSERFRHFFPKAKDLNAFNMQHSP